MPYSPIYSEDFGSALAKLKKRNKVLFGRLCEKMNEILDGPEHYKPLGNVLKGCRRVHVGHFVLIFEIDEANKAVVFLKFEHHDKAYG